MRGVRADAARVVGEQLPGPRPLAGRHVGARQWRRIERGCGSLGQVVGSTDSKGGHPKDRPLSPQDLLATMYRHLGIDPKHEFKDLGGRPIPILNSGEPIRELVG